MRKNYVQWLLLFAIVSAIIIAVVLFIINPNTITSYSTAIIALATVIYSYFSIKNYVELKRQNDFLKERVTENYILERKKPVLDLLYEININAVVVGTVLGTINNVIDLIERTEEDKIIESVNSTVSTLNKMKDILSRLDNDPYLKFSKNNLSFKSDNLNSKIEIYFNSVIIMPFINFNLFEQYRLIKDINNNKLIEKIDGIKQSLERVLKFTCEIFDDVNEDMGIDYRKLPNYMPY